MLFVNNLDMEAINRLVDADAAYCEEFFSRPLPLLIDASPITEILVGSIRCVNISARVID